MTEDEFRTLAAAVDRSERWGPDDRRGALNFLDVRTTLAATGEVRRGEVISCVDAGLGARPVIAAVATKGENWLAVDETITFEQHGAASMTHFDAFGHFFYDRRGHAGLTPDLLTPEGVSDLDVQAAATGIVGRGLLIDLPAAADVGYLRPGHYVGLADLERWLRASNTRPQRGDILFVRTGRPKAPAPEAGGYPRIGGLDLECTSWVHDSEFSLIVSDAGMDTPESDPPLVENMITPWHVLTLTRMGISLVDFADLEALSTACAAAGRYTFMAVLGVLPLRGSTASPVNPLAIL